MDDDDKKLRNRKIKVGIIYFSVIIIGLMILYSFTSRASNQTVKYSQFKSWVTEGKVREATLNVDSGKIIFQRTDDEFVVYNTIATENLSIVTAFLEENKVKDFDGDLTETNLFLSLLIQIGLPMVIFLIAWYFISKNMGRGMGDAMSFGKNNAKIYAENETGITFNDVAGEDEAKETLEEIVDLLHNPKKYADIGATLPKGALLVGPPGTGKTMLAKAVAGEAHVPFFSMSGSEFVQMFVGMGAARVRDLFKQAQEKAPCIVFIDEIDAIGKSRDNSINSNDEREQTLNQLLTEMDGFDASKGVVILGATNRPEVLDPALLRPGRFDRQVNVEIPDYLGRLAILQVHSRKVKMSSSVNLDAIAKTTPGASGADLANIINEGALTAVRKGRNLVEQWDLEEALDIVTAGKIKKDRVLSPKEKQAVAYHEIGHAFLGHMLPNAEEIHKITIIPRTKGALGYTAMLPGEEKYLVTREEMEDKICSLLGGRAAEEVMLGQVSTGASNDIERATETARRMVTIYGMTSRFDMVALESTSSSYLDGRPVRKCSEETEKAIDDEILAIIKKQHERAVSLLFENREKVQEISSYLLEKESITGEEFLQFFNA